MIKIDKIMTMIKNIQAQLKQTYNSLAIEIKICKILKHSLNFFPINMIITCKWVNKQWKTQIFSKIRQFSQQKYIIFNQILNKEKTNK